MLSCCTYYLNTEELVNQSMRLNGMYGELNKGQMIIYLVDKDKNNYPVLHDTIKRNDFNVEKFQNTSTHNKT